MSPRAVRTLRDVDLIAAEDTRHSRRLLAHFAIETPTVSYHKHNQRARRERLLGALTAGDVALITDAGTPAISDPGAELVTAALAAGYRCRRYRGLCPGGCRERFGVDRRSIFMLGFLPRERAERLRLVPVPLSPVSRS